MSSCILIFRRCWSEWTPMTGLARSAPPTHRRPGRNCCSRGLWTRWCRPGSGRSARTGRRGTCACRRQALHRRRDEVVIGAEDWLRRLGVDLRLDRGWCRRKLNIRGSHRRRMISDNPGPARVKRGATVGSSTIGGPPLRPNSPASRSCGDASVVASLVDRRGSLNFSSTHSSRSSGAYSGLRPNFRYRGPPPITRSLPKVFGAILSPFSARYSDAWSWSRYAAVVPCVGAAGNCRCIAFLRKSPRARGT